MNFLLGSGRTSVVLAMLVGETVLVAAGFALVTSTQANRLPSLTQVQADPLPDTTLAPDPTPTPVPTPDHVFLQVPFTTQAPLNNWAQHQESCEAANLTMLWLYWNHDDSVVVDPQTANGFIDTIDGWKPRPDLNDELMGELAAEHWNYTYRILPNSPEVIAEELAAGRPLLAEVRTHGLGNPHYPGYYSHYEQAGWSVPHFVTIVGYDSTGVWLNDPGISLGRGYHITYAQLSHAIDDLDQHYPDLDQGQVLLLIAPVAKRVGLHTDA